MVVGPLSEQGPGKRQKHSEIPVDPPGGIVWGHATGVVKFRDLKLSHVPEIKMLGHRLGNTEFGRKPGRQE